MAKKDYSELAQAILDGVGGPSNIVTATHCVTRLRFKLKDKSIADTEKIEALKGVIQVMDVPGQYQVVVGPKVYDVYDDVIRLGNLQGGGEVAADDGEEEEAEKKGVLGTLIDLISGIIAPVLGCMASTGMIKGLLALCTFLGIMQTTDGAYITLYAIGDGFMTFMPIILGVTAARKFKMNEFIGASIGAALVYTTISATGMSPDGSGVPMGTVFGGTFMEMSYYNTFFGIPIILPPSGGYTSTILPIIISCWVGSYVYRWANKVMPATVKLFLVPLVTLLASGTLAFLLIGPISAMFTNLIAAFFNAIMNIPVVGGGLAGAALGAVWQVLVIFGFHWALVPIAIANFSTLGYDMALSGQFGCTWAQIACVLVVILKTHDEELKETGIAAFITGIFGTTEPAIYGVTLPLRKPFIISCIAGAISGAFYGFMQTKTFVMGYSGLLGITSYIDPRTPEVIALTGLPNQGITHMIYAVIGVVIAFVSAFVMCWLFWKPKEDEKAEKAAA